jgi:uncharacterized protein
VTLAGTPATLAWLASISLLAGVAKGLTGFGGALVMAPLFGLLLGPADTAAMIVFVHCVTSLQGIRQWGRVVRWRSVLPLAAVALVSAALAAHWMAGADARRLRHATAIAVLAITVLHMHGWRWRHHGSGMPLVAAGVVSGMLTALAGLGGPPAVYYFAGIDQGPALRANLLGYFAALFCGTALLFAISHRITVSHAITSVGLAPAFAIGVLLGERSGARMSRVAFDRIVSGLLLLSGCLALVS